MMATSHGQQAYSHPGISVLLVILIMAASIPGSVSLDFLLGFHLDQSRFNLPDHVPQIVYVHLSGKLAITNPAMSEQLLIDIDQIFGHRGKFYIHGSFPRIIAFDVALERELHVRQKKPDYRQE